jgi:tRNA(Ile)-lysidine synthase
VTSQLHQRVRKTIERHALCPPGSNVLVAISGGSDSVALVFVLRDLAENGKFAISGLAHLNHALRPTADRDEMFCRELADRLRLRIAVKTEDVMGYARGRNLSIEDAARRIRYDFLEQVAVGFGADRIAVGHTQDDQAETFLLKLIRGAGLTGLSGIRPQRGRVIRPLLDVPRAELRKYLKERGQPWLDDESNEEVGNPRNRIRHRVLPELDDALGGSVRPAIARAAGLAREDTEWLDGCSERRYHALMERIDGGVTIEASALKVEPPPVRRRILLMALREAAGGREVGWEHVEAAVSALMGSAGGCDFPGGRLELRRGKLVLIQQKPTPK